MLAIKIQNLSFSYANAKNILDNVNLTVNSGEKLALIGPNGAGKSTLLLHLNGILRGDGKITIFEDELCNSNIKEIRRTVGLVFQDPNNQLFCPTVYDDVALGPLHFDWQKNKFDQVVKQALINTDTSHLSQRSPHHLSVGERRRASIATVIACEPKILIFDEPTANLDPRHKRELIEFIKKGSRTMIIATHDLELAKHTCTTAALMDKGKIVFVDSIEAILNNKELLDKHLL